MFNAHVEDEAQYERDPVNPNFLKRKPPVALIQEDVILPGTSEDVELNDSIFDQAKANGLLGNNEDDAIKFAWLVEHHKNKVLQHFGVTQWEDIEFDTQESIQSLDVLYRSVKFGENLPAPAPREKRPKVSLEPVSPLSVNDMVKLIKDSLEDYALLDRFRSYDALKQAQAAYLWQETGQSVEEDQVSGAFVKLTSGNPKYRNLYNALYSVVDPEKQIVEQMEAVLDPLVQEAMRPLYNFMGCIDAVERYAAKHYRHFYPLKKGNKSLSEFQRNNKHLGNEVLVVAADYARELAGYPKPIDRRNLTLIGQGVAFPTLTVKAKELIRPEVVDLLMPGAPEWIYCMCGSATMHFMLSYTTYGALQMAAQELGLPDDLKAIIDSTDVSHKFAEFVAHKFFTAQGGVAQVSSISGDSVQYRVSSGFNTTRQANHKWLLGCKLWFKQVYWAANRKRSDAIAKAEANAATAHAEYKRQDRILGELFPPGTGLDRYNLAAVDFNTLQNAGAPDPNIVIGQSQVVKQVKLAWKEAEIARVLAHCQPERVLRHSSNGTRLGGTAEQLAGL